MRDIPNIMLVGDRYTPLSTDCHGCHNFEELCEGSVFRGECPTGQVADIAPSIIARIIDHQLDNRFTVARAFGYKDELLEINSELLDDDLKIQLEVAKALTEEEVKEIQKKYLVEEYQYTRIFD